VKDWEESGIFRRRRGKPGQGNLRRISQVKRTRFSLPLESRKTPKVQTPPGVNLSGLRQRHTPVIFACAVFYS